MPDHDWERSYATVPPWDVGHPQPALAELEYRGRVLDAGCGTGEHALLAAERGADALGIDVAPTAIELARAKAAARGLTARFRVLDALELTTLGEQFDIVVDSGLYHAFPTVAARRGYARGLVHVVAPGGMLYLMCFSDLTPGSWGPQRIGEDELRATFADSWEIESLDHARFDINPGWSDERPHAWRLVARRS